MTPPRWFYLIVAVAVAVFAGASALRNLSAVGDSRFSYHPETSSHSAVVFDSRTGESCEWLPSSGKPVIACYDFRGRRIDLWHGEIDRHFPQEAEPPPMDTGMKMMDSSAIRDSIARGEKR